MLFKIIRVERSLRSPRICCPCCDQWGGRKLCLSPQVRVILHPVRVAGGVSMRGQQWLGGGGRDVVEEEGGAGASTPASFRLVCASVLPPPRWKPHLPAPSSLSSRPPLSSFPPALGFLSSLPRSASELPARQQKVSVLDGGMDPGFDHWRKGAFLPGFQAAGAAFIVYGEWKFGGMFSNPEAGVTEGAGGGEEVTTISVDKIFFF